MAIYCFLLLMVYDGFLLICADIHACISRAGGSNPLTGKKSNSEISLPALDKHAESAETFEDRQRVQWFPVPNMECLRLPFENCWQFGWHQWSLWQGMSSGLRWHRLRCWGLPVSDVARSVRHSIQVPRALALDRLRLGGARCCQVVQQVVQHKNVFLKDNSS